MTLLSNRKAIPPFAALRAFEAVGRIGGVRKAALELCVDHAVVSRHLRFLEDWLGATLFDRAGTSLRLTRNGEAYHQKVSAAINDIARATHDMTATPRGAANGRGPPTASIEVIDEGLDLLEVALHRPAAGQSERGGAP